MEQELLTFADLTSSVRPGGFQPALEKGLILWRHVEEHHTRSHIRGGINDFCVGFEGFLVCSDSQGNQRPGRERIHHVEITAVPAELTHARNDAHLRAVLMHLRMSNEGIPRRAPAFLFHSAPSVAGRISYRIEGISGRSKESGRVYHEWHFISVVEKLQ